VQVKTFVTFIYVLCILRTQISRSICTTLHTTAAATADLQEEIRRLEMEIGEYRQDTAQRLRLIEDAKAKFASMASQIGCAFSSGPPNGVLVTEVLTDKPAEVGRIPARFCPIVRSLLSNNHSLAFATIHSLFYFYFLSLYLVLLSNHSLAFATMHSHSSISTSFLRSPYCHTLSPLPSFVPHYHTLTLLRPSCVPYLNRRPAC
jgi:hypothetical protein